MANTITGVVLSVGQPYTVAAKSGQTFPKRDLYLDATRFDPYTGQRDERENILFFEFFGDKGVAELNNIQPKQVVTVSFVLQGNKYERDGQMKYLTKVSPYRVEPVVRNSQSAPAQSVQQPAAQVYPGTAPTQVAPQQYAPAPQQPVQAAPFPPPVNAQGAPQPQQDNLPF